MKKWLNRAVTKFVTKLTQELPSTSKISEISDYVSVSKPLTQNQVAEKLYTPIYLPSSHQ